MNQHYKILVIEDDNRVASLLQRGLTESGFDVLAVHNATNALFEINNNKYDVVITDIMLPDANGLELCRKIRNLYPQVPIIMLTALGNTDDKVEGFDAGADDYLVKPFEIRELIARIKTILKRYEHFSGKETDIISYAEIEMNLKTKTVKRKNIPIKLTPKEFGLLEYFLRNPERVLSRNEISEKVWNISYDTGTNFIDVYMNYLRNKIDKNFEHKLLHTVSGMGFILKKDFYDH
ncbi:MAG: response regulator transcription factor [Flavobacteriales bacterium]|nr:response regulator transcription factor [Flavobacteriales bacterium]